jgi:hypothetical protein
VTARSLRLDKISRAVLRGPRRRYRASSPCARAGVKWQSVATQWHLGMAHIGASPGQEHVPA